MTFEVGVIGLGYVGGAVAHAYQRKNIAVHTFDVDASKNPTCNNLEDFLEKANFIYVAVPTPMTREGSCDTRIIDQVVSDICKAVTQKVIVIKSTVPPGTTERLQQQYPQHTFLFSPEFLTEANHLNDYLNQDVMLIGKSTLASEEVAEFALESQAKLVETVRYATITSATTAELYKYIANLFLATKVSFANEMAGIAEALGVSWDDIQHLIVHDPRLGKTHWKVPGPDGHKGFGGTCFPKDISAIIAEARKLNVKTPVLTAAWYRNISIDRPERDWEQMKGRAVSE